MWLLAVNASPNLHGLPGSNVLQKLIDGAQGWGLALSLLGLFVGMADVVLVGDDAFKQVDERYRK